MKIADASVRGYRREDLHDAWQRYLPPPAGKAEPAEPTEPASSDNPHQVPDGERVPEPLFEVEPKDPPLTCDVPEVPQVPLAGDRENKPRCTTCGQPLLLHIEGRTQCERCRINHRKGES